MHPFLPSFSCWNKNMPGAKNDSVHTQDGEFTFLFTIVRQLFQDLYLILRYPPAEDIILADEIIDGLRRGASLFKSTYFCAISENAGRWAFPSLSEKHWGEGNRGARGERDGGSRCYYGNYNRPEVIFRVRRPIETEGLRCAGTSAR